LYILI